MGTWAIDALGNDDAADWLYELYEGDALAVIDRALSAGLNQDYLEAPDAQQALAAAEVIARLQGRPDTTVAPDEELDQWIKQSKLTLPPATIQKAHKAIDRILADQSELKELWQESDEFKAWETSVLNLKGRIG